MTLQSIQWSGCFFDSSATAAARDRSGHVFMSPTSPCWATVTKALTLPNDDAVRNTVRGFVEYVRGEIIQRQHGGVAAEI
jgi:hypothetical protein